MRGWDASIAVFLRGWGRREGRMNDAAGRFGQEEVIETNNAVGGREIPIQHNQRESKRNGVWPQSPSETRMTATTISTTITRRTQSSS